MKKLITLSALLALSVNAFADEGNNAFDDVAAAISSSSFYDSNIYEVGEGNDIWFEANQIASIQTLPAPPAVGDIDLLYHEDSPISDLIDAD